jgi:gluconolactonase
MTSAQRARPVATGLGFTEGPVATQAGEHLVVSTSHGCVYRLADGGGERFADTSGAVNGATEGADGAIYLAQAGGHSKHYLMNPDAGALARVGGIQRAWADGRVEWVTMDPVTPNDLCFGPDGLLYFTDPTRGRRDDGRLWRCDPITGLGELLASTGWYPNGIGFSADDALWVADTFQCRMIRYSLDDGRLGAPETAIQLDGGYPDGFAFDLAGNVVIGVVSVDGSPSQVETWSQNGERLDVFDPGPGERFTNVAFTADGGLLICDATAGAVLLVDDWPEGGLQLHPFR